MKRSCKYCHFNNYNLDVGSGTTLIKCDVFFFPSFLVSRYHKVTEPLLLSPGQVAFLSTRSKTQLLLLASSTTDRKVFIGLSQGNHAAHFLLNGAALYVASRQTQSK